jgi:dynein heavy chain
MKARKFQYAKPDVDLSIVKPAKPQRRQIIEEANTEEAQDSRTGYQTRTENRLPDFDIGGGEAEFDQVYVERLIRKPFEPNPAKLSILPKVTASVVAPLKVEIERRIRIYALQDINHLLKAEQVDLHDLLPDVRKCNGEGNDETLALWHFDDNDVEVRTPAQWLELGKTWQADLPGAKEVISVPAFACQAFDLCGGSKVKFVEATVCGYDEDAAMYQVRLAGEDRVLLRARVLLMFKADDPFMFAKRVAAALFIRDKTTRELVYNLCLDYMPVDFLPAMTEQQVQQIIKKAVTTKKLLSEHVDASKGQLAPEKSSIIEEVNLDYLRALNRCILDQKHSENNRLPVQEQNRTLTALARPESTWGPLGKGCIEMPQGYDYKQKNSEFSFRSFVKVPEVWACISKVMQESQRITNSCLFATTTAATRPEEFEQMQVSHREKTAELLREQWVASVNKAVKRSLENIGKGWFNLQEHRMNVYLQSKLSKLMTQIKFIMQDSIKTLSDNSTQVCVCLSFCLFVCQCLRVSVCVRVCTL